jgi:energy-coupling factor transporter ATP-binding protein EcfA2
MESPILEARRLSYKYPDSPDWVLRDISLAVAPGEFLAIVGPTGAGKTTLALCLRGLIPHNFGGTMAGDVIVEGESILPKTPAELAATIGIVFQNPEAQAIGLTVLEDLSFGLGNLRVPPEEMRARIDQLAEVVQLGHLLDRETWALSGGQKQRLAIASVLAMQPKILIMDEPTAELDPRSKRELFRVVRDLQRQRELTIVMIEHEVEELAEAADRILLLSEGRVAAVGTPEKVLRQVALFGDVHERVPYVAELLAGLIAAGLLQEGEFTPREEEAVARLGRLLARVAG